MKIQKGLVKYKDRSDIVCTYAVTDDGRQYYFLNDSKLSNDNIIVTTSLVEAIDPSVVSANIGVINANGDMVLECNHKSIKLITKDILLVENANPITPSVIEAVNLRKDPLAATNLVSTPAVIKDKMFALMGNDGRFLFNDQFSEASLFDLDGNNLLDNKYYSFISLNKKGDTLYLCGNTKESEPDTFSLLTNKFNDTTAVPDTAPVPDTTEENINIEDATVDKNDIEQAMTAPPEVAVPPVEEAPASEVVEAPVPGTEDQAELPVEDTPSQDAGMGVDIVPPVEEPIPEAASDMAPGEVPMPEDTVPVPEAPAPEEPVPAEVPAPEEPITHPEAAVPPVEEPVPVSDNSPVTVSPEEVQEVTGNDDNTIDDIKSILDVVTDKNTDIPPVEVEPSHEEFSDLDTYVNNVPDKIEDNTSNSFEDLLSNSNFDYGDNNYDHMDYGEDNALDDITSDDSYNDRTIKYSSDGIMNDAANTLSKLIDANKNQQTEIKNYKDQLKELTVLNKKVVDKARRDRDRVKSSIKNYESEIDRLKEEMESLKDRVHEKERIISNQGAELSNLRTQVEGKNNLKKMLEDAESLLGSNNYN